MKRKLDPESVLLLIADLDAGMPRMDVARKHGVTPQTVWQIDAGQTWAEVTGRKRDDGEDMTEAELDRLIAEQLPSMPGNGGCRGRTSRPLAVSRGLGTRASGR